MMSAVYLRLNKMAELNDAVIKMADILNLNENLLCIIISLILRVILKTDTSICLMS